MDTHRDTVMMRGGQVVMMVDGEMLIMEKDVITADGSQLKTDGTIIAPDGTMRMLANDEAVIIDRLATRLIES